MILRINVITSVIFLTVCLSKNSFAQTNEYPHIPCPDVFQYMRNGNRNIGIITINDVRYGRTTVTIELSQHGFMELSNPGQLSLNINKDKIYEYIDAGKPLKYRVDFPLQNNVPRVTSIKVNDIQICSGPAYGSPRTTMTLEHTLNAYSSGPISSQKPEATFHARRPSRPNFIQGSTFDSNMPEFLRFSPSFVQKMSSIPSSLSQPHYHQHSFTQPPFIQPSYTPPSYTPQSFTQHVHSKPSYTPTFHTPPSFSQHKFNFPSFHQPSFNPSSFLQFPSSMTNKPAFDSPILSQPTNNQMNSEFSPNPKNPFLNNSAGIDTYRPVEVYGPRNAQPTPSLSFEPPTSTPTSTPSPVIKPIFTSPTTMNFTQSPPFQIDVRNPDPTTSPVPEPASTDRATFEYINSICGRENLNFDITKLNVKGTFISRSRFPWIVAVFRKNEDALDFRCGGSLISTRTIVSAAHCFYLGLEAMKPDDILISMGRHNLTDWLDANNVDADRVILHPDYRPSQTNFDADLAIVRLKASVTFTTSVRPICMWQGNNDAREIVGMSGVIVGWGSDGRRNTTTVPTLVNATVVAEITCIRSNDQFVSLTSNRTLCAGNLDGSGPCMGDSGNGLMIRNRNKWMLRGTVSAALGTPTRQCVLDQYAIYSDIAMFIEWIRSNMSL